MNNLSDMTMEQLEDYRKRHEDAAKIALEDLDFSNANVLNEQARKAQEEINWRKRNGKGK